MSEARLRQEILKRIRDDYPPSKSQVLVFGRPAGPSTGPGHPDLFGVAAGRFYALEIKLPKEKPTPVQLARLGDLRRAGAYAWVIRSTLDATRAVFVAKRGGPVPMSSDPIDFDEWFKGLGTPSEPVIAEPLPKTSEEMQEEPDPLPILDAEAAANGVTLPPEEPVIETPYQVFPASEETIQEQANLDQEQYLRAVEAESSALAAKEYNALHAAVEKLDKDLRAVGDRVTEVYEACNRVETLLRSRHVLLGQMGEEIIRLSSVINKLLQEVQADDLVEGTLVDEPTPLDDVLPEEPKRRGRPRKAS